MRTNDMASVQVKISSIRFFSKLVIVQVLLHFFYSNLVFENNAIVTNSFVKKWNIFNFYFHALRGIFFNSWILFFLHINLHFYRAVQQQQQQQH